MNDPRTSVDWNHTTVLRKHTPKGKQTVENPLAIKGNSLFKVETTRRDTGNHSRTPGVISNRKLDEATEPDALPTVSLSLGQKIQAGRRAKTPAMTQAQLAQAINVKVAIINDYEQGRGIPDNTVINKLERALSVKLRA
jgi:putative transcription factor